jgi:hypothetical protein
MAPIQKWPIAEDATESTEGNSDQELDLADMEDEDLIEEVVSATQDLHELLNELLLRLRRLKDVTCLTQS